MLRKKPQLATLKACVAWFVDCIFEIGHRLSPDKISDIHACEQLAGLTRKYIQPGKKTFEIPNLDLTKGYHDAAMSSITRVSEIRDPDISDFSQRLTFETTAMPPLSSVK